MIYKCCEFPLCDKTSIDNRIQNHHIIPIKNKGLDNSRNKIYLCPNHHNLIYILGENNGIHSTKLKGSIMLLRRMSSTDGRILVYIDCDDNKKKCYFYRTKEIVEYDKIF